MLELAGHVLISALRALSCRRSIGDRALRRNNTWVGLEELLPSLAFSFNVNGLLRRRRILVVGFARVYGALLTQKRRN